jgi:glycosyltransferase involved in cell wall biosynthesis
VITVATIVKNEAERFLPSALECWKQFADRIVAVDDGSKDDSYKLLKDAGCEVYRETFDLWGNESAARKFLWDKAVKDSEWVIHIDADMVPARNPVDALTGKLVGFRVYDLWDTEGSYRSDRWWTGHRRPYWLAANVSDHQGVRWEWGDAPIHSGHLPLNARELLAPAYPLPPEVGMLHYAYSQPQLRRVKYDKYMDVEEHLNPRQRLHAKSIIDEMPRLEKLGFKPEWELEWQKKTTL